MGTYYYCAIAIFDTKTRAFTSKYTLENGEKGIKCHIYNQNQLTPDSLI